MKRELKKGITLMLIVAMLVSPVDFGTAAQNVNASVKAAYEGSLATEVTGTWSYWNGDRDVVQTNKMLLDKLPTRANKGAYRWTTEDYDATTGPLDIGGFATSMAWNYSSNAFGNSVYAIPMSYVAKQNGIFVTKPSTISVEDTYTATIFMNQPEDGSLSDFLIGTNYSFSSSKVDKVTEWSTDIIMENASDSSQYMKTIMTQGSPFSFFELTGTTSMTIKRNRNLPSAVTYYNGTSIADSTLLVIRVYDNQDLVTGYGDYDYYALYVPQGTTWLQADATASYADNRMGHLTANFSNTDRAYMTLAYLCETSGQNDAVAKNIALEYEKYAYNFITDTNTSFIYDRNNGTVTTTYTYTLDKKAESKADGTVMGILPHQYKNMSGYTYLDHTTRTIRGTMKYIVGSSYQTVLTYSGILPSMPSVEDADKPQLQEYIDEFMDKYGPTDTELTKESYDVNTYDTGKKLNRALQVMQAAEECGDTDTADRLLEAIERELADWYTATGTEKDRYFYYDKEVGSLFGFPQSYYTVDGMTDHHFHYGYFIQASAQVALRDPSFAQKYGNIVEELIGDIATYEKNSPDARYPFLRYFSTYEGHSWASGHANFADGNNQESSSEALNAWAALILWGQATQNQDLTDLGVYLYQTEISAVNNYWFDVDGDVLDTKFKKISPSDSSLPKYVQASMVWGGKYTYATWWTAEPLQIQGINLLPITSASLYLAKNKDYIITNWKTANSNESRYNGVDKDTKRWNELWSSYLAIADSHRALEYFDDVCPPEAGDSKARAYHYIMALDKAGSPDLTVTSDNPLAAAFKNADGDMTYVAYNATNNSQKVTFSDGATLTVQPGQMASSAEGEISGKCNYKVEHYLQNAGGTYDLFQTEIKSAKVDSEVTAIPKAFEGYSFNKSAAGSILKGVAVADGSLKLKLYYDIAEIDQTEPGQDTSNYTKLGSYDGYEISYYVLQDDFGIANIQLLDSNRTFYVVYSGDYDAGNTTGYLNRQESPGNILKGVYNLQIPSLAKDSWNTIKIISGSKQVYIIVKYGNPSGGPNLTDYEGEITTADPDLPTEVSGFVVGSPNKNTIIVTFRATEEQNVKGQLYNIYVDENAIMNYVTAGTYTFNDISAGRHIVRVTAVLNGKESAGISGTVKVEGVSQETSSNLPTTTNPQVDESSDVETSISAQVSSVPEESTTFSNPETFTESITSSEMETLAETTDESSHSTIGAVKKVKVKRAKFKKIKRYAKRKVKVSLKKMKNVSGYKVKYSTKKKFKKKYTNIKFVKKRKFKLKKLKVHQKYYIKVRAYRVVNGKKYYGKWSKKKVIRAKKKK